MARIHSTLPKLAVLTLFLAAYTQQVVRLSKRHDLFWQEFRDTIDASALEIVKHASQPAEVSAITEETRKPSSVSSARMKYLVADLQFGLTNQAIEAFVAVLIAQKLNRTLVLPKVRLTIPKGQKFATAGSKAEPFSYIWDPDFYIRCARDKLNKPNLAFVLEDDDIHYQANDMNIEKEHTYHLQKWDGNDHITPLLAGDTSNNDLLTRLVNDTADYIKVICPFHYRIAAKWNAAECFKPSVRLQSMIDRYKAKLPEKYACLHARTEVDWYQVYCCSNKYANVTSPHPHLWTCNGGGFHDSNQAEQCKQKYATPEQIAEFIQADGLPLNSSLWISSGSSRQTLSPLYRSFRVYTKEEEDATNNGVFMDYGLAQVDKAVCGGAAQFWGVQGSTFSGDVAKAVRRNGGDARWYIH